MFNTPSSKLRPYNIYKTFVCSVVLLCGAAQATNLQIFVQTGTAAAPTGTPTFTASDANGGDTGGTNLIVRSFDTITYDMQIGNQGTDTNVKYVSTLPQGPNGELYADWEAIPVECLLPGSSISADGQTLTCVVGNITNTARSILPDARVRSTTPNGTALPLPTTTISSDQLTTPYSNPNAQMVTVSSAPRYNLRKTAVAPSPNPNYLVRSATGPDGTTPGFVIAFPLNISAVDSLPANTNDERKGLAPLQDPVTLSDVLANVTSSDLAAQAAFRANAVLYNAAGSNWKTPQAKTAGGCILPNDNSFLNIPNLPNVNNGTCTATQTGGKGGPINISLSGMKTDGSTRNTIYNVFSIMSRELLIWIPETVIPPNSSVTFTNAYSDFNPLSASGQPNVQSTTADDSTPFVVSRTVSNGSATANKRIGNVNNRTYTDGARDYATIVLKNTGNTSLDDVILCDKYDNTKFVLYGTGSGVSNSTDDTGASIQSVGLPTGFKAADYMIEYGTGGVGGVGDTWASDDDRANATCADDQSTVWYTDATKGNIPGAPSTPADKLAPITKVRMRLLKPLPAGSTISFSPKWRATATPLVGPNTGTRWPNNQEFINWAAVTTSTSNVFGTGSNTATDANGQTWLTDANTAGPRTRDDDLVDSARIIAASVGVAKTAPQIKFPNGQIINNPTTGKQVPAGSTVTYQLAPTLSTVLLSTGTTSYAVTVADTLPNGISYIPGSASPVPSSVNMRSNGTTLITWIIPSVTPNSAIPAITFKGLVAATLPDGTNQRNAVIASSPADPNSASSYFDVLVSNPPGFRVSKAVLTPHVAPNGVAQYKLAWFSIGSGTTGNTQFIDVLPYLGDGAIGRTPSSDFVDKATLAAQPTPPTNDNSMKFYYTKQPPAGINQDPQDTSNDLSTGSTKWCLYTNFGSAGCPANLGEVTAVRGISTLAAMVADTEYSVTLKVQTSSQPRNGDKYTNSFTGRSSGLQFATSSESPYAVVDLVSLAGSVYNDVNDDGDRAGSEAGIPNTKIVLGGYHFGPDGQDNGGSGDDVSVSITTQTDSNGNFVFGNLAPGQYKLTETQPSGWEDGKEKAGSKGGNISVNDTISSIVLNAGDTATGYLFGERSPLAATPPILRKWADVCDTVATCPAPHNFTDAITTSVAALPGQIIQYTIIFKNPSSGPAQNVVLKDIVPANTVLVGALAAGLDGVTGTALYRLGSTGSYGSVAPTAGAAGAELFAGISSNNDGALDSSDEVKAGGSVRLVFRVQVK